MTMQSACIQFSTRVRNGAAVGEYVRSALIRKWLICVNLKSYGNVNRHTYTLMNVCNFVYTESLINSVIGNMITGHAWRRNYLCLTL